MFHSADSKKEAPSTVTLLNTVLSDIKIALSVLEHPEWEIKVGKIWSLEVMRAVLRFKQLQAEKAGMPFFGYAFIMREEKNTEEKHPLYSQNNEEILGFIEFLKENRKKFPIGLQFSVLIQVGDHWELLFHEVSHNGFDVFVIDAALNPRGDLIQKYYISEMVDKELLTRVFYYGISGSEELYHLQDEGTYMKNLFAQSPVSEYKKKLMIQKNDYTCAVYAIDQAFTLSRINPFFYLGKAFGAEQIVYLKPDETPNELAVIYRLTQSRGFIKGLSSAQQKILATPKRPLEDAEKHKEQIQLRLTNKDEINKRVIEKGAKILTKLQGFIQSLEENKVDNFFAPESKMLSIFVDHYSEAVVKLVNLIHQKIISDLKLSNETRYKFLEKLYLCMNQNLPEDEKCLQIFNICLASLENQNNADNLLISVIAYIVLREKSNPRLWALYKEMADSGWWNRLENSTFSFFNKFIINSKLSLLEEIFKIQILSNLLIEDNSKFLLSPPIKAFLSKPRFVKKETFTETVLATLSSPSLQEDARKTYIEEVQKKLAIKQVKLLDKLSITDFFVPTQSESLQVKSQPKKAT